MDPSGGPTAWIFRNFTCRRRIIGGDYYEVLGLASGAGERFFLIRLRVFIIGFSLRVDSSELLLARADE